MRGRNSSILGVIAASVSFAVAGAAEAGVGFFFDASTLRFSYVKGAGAPGSIGRVTVNDFVSSSLAVQHLDLGADGEVGGVDDTLLDMARIGNSASFDVNLVADVFKLGANNYVMQGQLRIKDASGTEVVVGDLFSPNMFIGGGFFAFDGWLSNPGGILQPDNTDSWLFTGLGEDTPDFLNGQFGGADATDGTIRINDGRGSFANGSLVEFQFVGKFNDLDHFFDANRGSTGADMKVAVVPVPGAALLGALGLSVAYALRRRMAV